MVALLGTQVLFWGWHSANYHPEKFPWAVGLQACLFLLHLGLGWLAPMRRDDTPSWEEQIAQALNAAFWFGAIYHTAAGRGVGVARADRARHGGVVRGYGLAGDQAIELGPARRSGDRAGREPFSRSLGRCTHNRLGTRWAGPLKRRSSGGSGYESRRPRIAGWRPCCSCASSAICSTDRIFRDTEHYWLLLNRNAAPALAATSCLLLGLAAGARWLTRVSTVERVLAGAAAVVALVQAGAIVSSDLSIYFAWRHESPELAEMLISSWWGLYATALLFAGFRARRPLLRWLALVIYAVTTFKVFLVDLANLDQIVRILAFFVLAMLLGFAAWIYQRIIPANSHPPSAGD